MPPMLDTPDKRYIARAAIIRCVGPYCNGCGGQVPERELKLKELIGGQLMMLCPKCFTKGGSN